MDSGRRRALASVLANERSEAIEHAKRILSDGPGTVVVWENLDRVLPERCDRELAERVTELCITHRHQDHVGAA